VFVDQTSEIQCKCDFIWAYIAIKQLRSLIYIYISLDMPRACFTNSSYAPFVAQHVQISVKVALQYASTGTSKYLQEKKGGILLLHICTNILIISGTVNRIKMGSRTLLLIHILYSLGSSCLYLTACAWAAAALSAYAKSGRLPSLMTQRIKLGSSLAIANSNNTTMHAWFSIGQANKLAMHAIAIWMRSRRPAGRFDHRSRKLAS